MFFFHKCCFHLCSISINCANLYTVKNSISFNFANYLYNFGYSVMEIHREIWNNDILRPELPLSLFNCKLCRVYNIMGAQNATGRKFTKARTYTKRCFIRHDIREKKDMKEEVRSSPVSICCVRPSAAPGRKHHQIRAYILLIKVIEVRHHQIRVHPLR